MQRDTVLSVVRVLVSVGLLVVLVHSVDVDALAATLADLAPSVLVAAIGLSVMNVAISAYKWGLLLRIKEIDLPFRTLFAYYYVGQFFNAFLPTSMGGDGARAYYLESGHDAGPDAVSSVVVERLTGLLSVLLVGGLATVFLLDRVPATVATTVLAVCLPGGALLLLLLFTDAGRRFLAWTAFRISWRNLGERIAGAYDAIHAYRDARRMLLPAVLLSLVFRLVLVGNHYVVATGLGMDVPVAYFFAVVPLVELLLALPVSIQGFGVRETAYVYLFGAAGATSGVSLALGVSMGLILAVFNNVLGGVVYLVGRPS